MLKKVLIELGSFSRREIFFILSAMLCGFLISAEYSIIRPVSNSLFISSYGASLLPYAWLLSVPLNFLVVMLYNRFLPRLGCFRMFLIIASIIGGGNLLSALFMQKFASLPFLFYVWKETYIMLMFQQLWSVIHATIDLKRAKYLYGILFGIGGLGSVLGSLLPGFVAVKLGSENLLAFSLPIYALLLISYTLLLKNSGVRGGEVAAPQSHTAFAVLKNIGSSRYLLFILSIVVFMQTAATVLDFQFNTLLEQAVSDKDLRTQYAGRIFSLVHTATIFLQFVGSFLLIRFLGLRISHLAIPALLCLNALAFLAMPLFGVMAFSFITIKSFDFSLFNIAKEMLYIPLKTDEKFRAKAFIDVFAYRGAKAFASGLILLLQLLAGTSLLTCLSWGLVLLFLSWCFTVFAVPHARWTMSEVDRAQPN